MNDRTVEAIEAEMRRVAQAVRPGLPRRDDRVTMTHLREALGKLQDEMVEVAHEGWRLVELIQGSSEDERETRGEKPVPTGPVFETLAMQITECARQLARLKRAHETLMKALS